MEVVFLGTGAGVPATSRNVSAIALQLLNERGATWLFDCGEATQHQILHTSIKPRRIEKIFITHLHGDHLFGLPGLLGSRSFQGGETPLTIYGPKGIKEFVDTTLLLSKTHLRYELSIIEIEEGILFEDEMFIVSAQLLDHGIASYGFRVEEKDLPGTLLVDKLTKIRISPGPILKKIKQGLTVTLEDGSKINGKDFVGPPKKGRVVTILGDTRCCNNSIELAKNADLLIHEATFSENEGHLATAYFHSTTQQAAKIAQKAEAKALILTHISSRYQGEDALKLLQEAKNYFENAYIANDFFRFLIENKQR